MDARKNLHEEQPRMSVRILEGATIGHGVNFNFNVSVATSSYEIKSSSTSKQTFTVPTPSSSSTSSGKDKTSADHLLAAGNFKPLSVIDEMISRIINKIKILMHGNVEYKENWSKLGSENQQKLKHQLFTFLNKPELVEKFSKLTGMERNAYALDIATTIVDEKKGFTNVVDTELRDYFTPENNVGPAVRKSIF